MPKILLQEQKPNNAKVEDKPALELEKENVQEEEAAEEVSEFKIAMGDYVAVLFKKKTPGLLPRCYEQSQMRKSGQCTLSSSRTMRIRESIRDTNQKCANWPWF